MVDSDRGAIGSLKMLTFDEILDDLNDDELNEIVAGAIESET